MRELGFSPLEERVLSLLGRWWSIEELKRQLFPQFPPSDVRKAIDYLRHHELVRQLERQHGTPLYERTELGTQVLGEVRRRRAS